VGIHFEQTPIRKDGRFAVWGPFRRGCRRDPSR
jgi:hypothetical protein